MSNRAVFIALLTAIALGLCALFLLQPETPRSAHASTAAPPAVPVGERLLDFAPSSVVEIRVATTAADAASSTILRRVRPGQPSTPAAPAPPSWYPDAEWLLTLPPSSPQTAATAWPVAPAQVQGLLRILSDVRAVALPPPTSSADNIPPLGERPTLITLVFRDGLEQQLTLAERTLAGVGLVHRTPPAPPTSSAAPRPAPVITRAMVPDDLHRLFTAPGPAAWRQPQIAAPLAAEASRITLASPAGQITLAKVAGQWSLRKPLPAPADPATVSAVLSALAKLSVVDFLDTPRPSTPPTPASTPADTGLANPAATITIEADRRTLAPGASDATVTTATLTIRIGGPADAQGKAVFAAINDAPPLLLAAEALQPIPADPARFIWPFVSALPAADIHALEFASGPSDAPRLDRLERDGPRWSLARAQGRRTPLADDELREVEQLLAFLTGAHRRSTTALPPSVPGQPAPAVPATPTVSLTPPPNLTPVGTLDILPLSATTTATSTTPPEARGVRFDIALTPDAHAVFSAAGIHRTVPRTGLPTVIDRWITNTAAPKPPAPSSTPPQPPA